MRKELFGDIPKALKIGSNESIYMYYFANIYLEKKVEELGEDNLKNKKIGIGTIIGDIIIKQPDFKQVINNHLEELKF